jgi:hypothetical protein
MSVMAVHTAQQVPFSSPLVIKDNIRTIAIKCFAELALSLCLGIVVSTFVPLSGVTLILSAIAIQIAVTVFFRWIGAKYLLGPNFALFSGFNINMLIHELGHAFAAKAVFTNVHPKIELNLFSNAGTKFTRSSLTSFGKLLGLKRSELFVTARGPGFALLIGSLLFGIGFAIRKKHPELAIYLISYGVLSYLFHAHYAWTAIGMSANKTAHDFVYLAARGLHPVVATVGIIAIPVIITLGIRAFS